MSLIGGGGSGAGGAGNPVGSNPAGTGSSINYVGNHAYAYSGVSSIGTAYTSVLEFATSSIYIMSNLQVYSASISGTDLFIKVSINGEAVIESAYNQQGQLDPAGYVGHLLLIPPFSNVKVELKGSTGTSDLSATLSGRTYA
jgi:hypothetical protein